jgi:hypothetical protein
MKKSHPDEDIIRQYLLGKLNDQKELEEELSEQMFFDDDLSQMVDSIEDEILDEYLDGNLTPADTQAVKEYFLCPQERKDKLQFARVMRRYFETSQTASATTRTAPPPWRAIGGGSAVLWRWHVRTYVEIAALLLLSTSYLLYMAHVRRELLSSNAENHKNQQLLEDERQRSASLEKQMAELLPVGLTLVNERSRSVLRDVVPLDVKPLVINPSTHVIKVEIALAQATISGAFDVALEPRTGGTPLWSKAGVPSSEGVLTFVMPPQGINAGSYSFAISPHGQPAAEAKHYDFEVTVTK